MFKEIAHETTQKTQVLNDGIKELLVLESALLKEKELMVKLMGKQRAEDFLNKSFGFLKTQVEDLNQERKNLFYSLGYLPKEFWLKLKIENGKIVLTGDKLTFCSAKYEITAEDLRNLCSKLNLTVIPFEAVDKSMKFNQEILDAVEESNSHIHVLTNVSALNLFNCLNISQQALESIIVPKAIENKWDSFVFQSPLFKEAYKRIEKVEASLSLMQQNLNKAFANQETFNQQVSDVLQEANDWLNKVSNNLHSLNGLNKNHLESYVDYNDPQYETYQEGYGKKILESDYNTIYEKYRKITVTHYPTKVRMVAATFYKNKWLESLVLPNLKKTFELIGKDDKMELASKVSQLLKQSYVVLRKKPNQDVYEVMTMVEGLSNEQDTALLNQMLFVS